MINLHPNFVFFVSFCCHQVLEVAPAYTNRVHKCIYKHFVHIHGTKLHAGQVCKSKGLYLCCLCLVINSKEKCFCHTPISISVCLSGLALVDVTLSGYAMIAKKSLHSCGLARTSKEAHHFTCVGCKSAAVSKVQIITLIINMKAILQMMKTLL